jgi:hypothetical protein
VKRERSPRRLRGCAPDELAQLVDEYQRSGLTQCEYASQLGVGYSTLTKWLKRARQHAPPDSSEPNVEFVPVRTPLSFGSPPYQLRWPGGLCLELARGFDPAEVRQLLSLLPPCSP